MDKFFDYSIKYFQIFYDYYFFTGKNIYQFELYQAHQDNNFKFDL